MALPNSVYAAGSSGMYISRSCGACHAKSSQAGGGIRLVCGFRTWVCPACKKRMDDHKQKDRSNDQN